NGAGKSTLMKILFGDEARTEGTILFEGREIHPNSASDTIKLGIGMVHQHFMLVNSLKVYENVILGMEPKKGALIDRSQAVKLVEDTAKRYNLNVDPSAVVGDLSVGLKQKVEILKVLARGAKLLILDEPTAVLTPQETQELFEQLLLLKKNGHTIIFISHKIREVMQICDNITVLRGGHTMGTMAVKDATEEQISRFMVGRDVILKVQKEKAKFGKPLLEVRNVSYVNREGKKALDRVSFELHEGQILGVAGVEGNGQNELAEAIFGFYGKTGGEVLFDGENILGESIRQIRDRGISYVPEDRIKTGVAGNVSLWGNLLADRIDDESLRTGHLMDNRKIHKMAGERIRDFLILCRNDSQPVGMLSGGNMQKVVVAREFSSDPRLLIANQPTRGIDVGANEFIWKKLVEQRDAGKAILLISADLNEIMELSDSILVMCDGQVAAFFEDSSQVDEFELGKYMLGIKKQEVAG
ncbi:MAG: ABC transporter ATP-binding protein, partial [Clostridiales bacterium]|nr:ABC transporter ATP-binding protein [Clostridiales bacterium]